MQTLTFLLTIFVSIFILTAIIFFFAKKVFLLYKYQENWIKHADENVHFLCYRPVCVFSSVPVEDN